MADWYYMSGGQQLGPVTGAQLKSMAATGSISREDFVWTDTMAEWAPAKKVKGLYFAPTASVGAATASAPTPNYAPPLQATAPAPQYAAAPQTYETAPQTYAPAEQAYTAPDYSQQTAYAEPVQQLGYSGRANDLTPRTMELLRRIRPWILTVAILFFIATAGLLVAGIKAVIELSRFSTLMNARTAGSSQSFAQSSIYHVFILTVIFLFIFSALAFFSGFYSTRCFLGLGRLSMTGRSADLETALDAQRIFWISLVAHAAGGVVFYLLALLIGP